MNRALLVGINKYPTQPLNGCVNDIEDMANFLVRNCQFKMNEIQLLADERATKEAIVSKLGWLLTGLRAGDRIVFHYSGHGVQLPTHNPQGEVDGLDEAICPVDFDWTDAHTIRDKEFNRIFSGIPDGVEFIWISDSCHSGDLDRGLLKTHVSELGSTTQVKTLIPPPDIKWQIDTANEKAITPQLFRGVASVLNLALISGCKSDQTSSDAYFGGKANGAMTYYLLQSLSAEDGLTQILTKVVENTNTALRNGGYSQEPQISGNPLVTARAFLSANRSVEMKNQFLVDLNAITLEGDQINAINSVVQKAISGELGKMRTMQRKIALLPLENQRGIGGHGGITQGLVAVES